MNQKNSLGLNSCFLDLNDPIQLFNVWMNEAKKTEPNDPNALSLATAVKTPRMIVMRYLGYLETLAKNSPILFNKY